MMVRSGNPASASRDADAQQSLLLLAACGTGWAQSAPPSLGLQEQGPQAAPPPSTPASSENPGLINEMGKLFDKLPSILPPIKSPSETMNDLSRLARPSTMVTGRVACPVSANGAPDCKPGADSFARARATRTARA